MQDCDRICTEKVVRALQECSLVSVEGCEPTALKDQDEGWGRVYHQGGEHCKTL